MSTGEERKNGGVPYQIVSAPLLCHVARTRIKTFLQCNYTREEVCNLILHYGGFLRYVSENDREVQIVGELCD